MSRVRKKEFLINADPPWLFGANHLLKIFIKDIVKLILEYQGYRRRAEKLILVPSFQKVDSILYASKELVVVKKEEKGGMGSVVYAFDMKCGGRIKYRIIASKCVWVSSLHGKIFMGALFQAEGYVCYYWYSLQTGDYEGFLVTCEKYCYLSDHVEVIEKDDECFHIVDSKRCQKNILLFMKYKTSYYIHPLIYNYKAYAGEHQGSKVEPISFHSILNVGSYSISERTLEGTVCIFRFHKQKGKKIIGLFDNFQEDSWYILTRDSQQCTAIYCLSSLDC